MDNTNLGFKFGLTKDLRDDRDYSFDRIKRVSADVGTAFTAVDLRTTPYIPPVANQGRLNSCSAFATTYLVDFVRAKLGKSPDFTPSQLFTYYATRKIENRINIDRGATMRNAIKSVVDYGVVDESVWPYDATKWRTDPGQAVFSQALNNQALEYFRITDGNVTQMKQCLADGYPFVFGMSLFRQFQSKKALKDGIVVVPTAAGGSIGGHAMTAVGWKRMNNQDYLICENSWGNTIGDQGFWYVPIAYLTKFKNKLAWDYWTIRMME
jgi:C1A family cysteine protease